MANTLSETKGTIVFNLLPDDMVKRFVGYMDYTAPDFTEKWVYKKLRTSGTVASAFADGDEYLTFYEETVGASSTNVTANADLIKFIYLRHTGFKDTAESEGTSKGLMICFTDSTPAFDGTGVTMPMILAPGDAIAIKLPKVPADDLKLRTCTLTNGSPTADGGSTDYVLVEIAAILDDVA